MPTADFCAINSPYLTHLVAGAMYKQGVTYVLRFVLDGWEAVAPASHKLVALADAVGGALAACDQLGFYQMKALVMRKAQPGEKIQYFYNHWYNIGVVGLGGSGCNESLTAGDGTWVMDLVFVVGADKTNMGSADNLVEYLRVALSGTRGAPQVYLGGIVPLIPGQGNDAAGAYEAAANFWGAKQAFWQFQQTKSETTPTGFYWSKTRVNYESPMKAWASVPFLGDGGVGISLGDAFEPSSIQPLKAEGTIQTATPDATSAWNTVTPSAGLTPQQKAVGVTAGILLGWVLGKRFLGW